LYKHFKGPHGRYLYHNKFPRRTLFVTAAKLSNEIPAIIGAAAAAAAPAVEKSFVPDYPDRSRLQTRLGPACEAEVEERSCK
jgi:hypothetical protein